MEFDFRDTNASFHINASFHPQSNQLPLNIFEADWETVPTHTNKNSAFGSIYSDIYYYANSWKVGVFYEQTGYVTLNDGMVQTIFESQQNFNTFLHIQDINKKITDTAIKGEAAFYELHGFFIQKIIRLSTNNWFSVKGRFFGAKDAQKLTVSGTNTQDRFIATLQYSYGRENYVSKREVQNKPKYYGYGHGFDIEYIFNNEKFYCYAGILNVGGVIYLKDITQMHYDFDSEVIYAGSDGYNHRKPFGVGYYKENISSRYYLPIFYRGSMDYAITDSLSVGNKIEGHKSTVFNSFYVTAKVNASRVKLGYMYEGRVAYFGIYFKNISAEISNNFSFSQKALYAKVHIWF